MKFWKKVNKSDNGKNKKRQITVEECLAIFVKIKKSLKKKIY